eukprot:791728-Karenia_brevis.AAC.1
MEESFFNPFRMRQTACINQSQARFAQTVRYWPPDISDHPSDYNTKPGVKRPPGCAVLLPHSIGARKCYCKTSMPNSRICEHMCTP